MYDRLSLPERASWWVLGVALSLFLYTYMVSVEEMHGLHPVNMDSEPTCSKVLDVLGDGECEHHKTFEEAGEWIGSNLDDCLTSEKGFHNRQHTGGPSWVFFEHFSAANVTFRNQPRLVPETSPTSTTFRMEGIINAHPLYVFAAIKEGDISGLAGDLSSWKREYTSADTPFHEMLRYTTNVGGGMTPRSFCVEEHYGGRESDGALLILGHDARSRCGRDCSKIRSVGETYGEDTVWSNVYYSAYHLIPMKGGTQTLLRRVINFDIQLKGNDWSFVRYFTNRLTLHAFVKDYERLNALLLARDDGEVFERDRDGDGDVDETDNQLFNKRVLLQTRIEKDPLYQHVKTFLNKNKNKNRS
eukprot:TRINITY_DN6394_c2_g1_i1.p1 TRINITY_DN6394_c2_g1~~TRINITY_DN6394_c2_g1_i1.p1  ORF type:complete len:370 (-),score=70.46 TRINITY_DN6394_c2_g1_i1:17-1090(-)